MYTANSAINKVWNLVNGSGVSYPVYKYTKPVKSTATEYAVVNSMPINSGVLQKCIVNVNYYTSDLAPGIPDAGKMELELLSLMAVLEQADGDGYMVDFESNQIGWDYNEGKHYANIKLSVKLINN